MDGEVIISHIILFPPFTLRGVVWVVCYSQTWRKSYFLTLGILTLWPGGFTHKMNKSAESHSINGQSTLQENEMFYCALWSLIKGWNRGNVIGKAIHKREWRWLRALPRLGHMVSLKLFKHQLSHKTYQFNRKHSNTPARLFQLPYRISSIANLFIYFCFTVTDAGSNSGIFGTSGSGGLAGAGAGAGAGLGSSFFLGAMARSSQESGRGATERWGRLRMGPSLHRRKTKPLYSVCTGISTHLHGSNKRKETIKG